MYKIWINGRFLNEKDAKISVFDRGFLYGDGVFETMRSYNGAVFKLNDHTRRLVCSLKLLGIRPPYRARDLGGIVSKALAKNRLTDAYIRIYITRGEGSFGIARTDRLIPNTVVVAKKFDGYPEWMHERGISAHIVDIRQNEHSPLSSVKSANFLNYIMARFEAKSRGADDAILVNTSGYVAEGATSNIFIVKGGVLKTPSADCGLLPGITRKAVLEMARKAGIRAVEKRIRPPELRAADEAFFTNSLAGVLPVVRIDSKRIGTGLPGELTKSLRAGLMRLTAASQ